LQVETATASLAEESDRDVERVTSEATARFGEAIKIYETLIREHPEEATSEVLYQLARAYEAMGELDRATDALTRMTELYPDAARYAEAQFRRGEIFFSERSFNTAEEAYRAVVQLGATTDVYERALYKWGWTLFELGEHEKSLDVFTRLLDRKIPAGSDPIALISALSGPEQEQIQDVFRAMSLSFSYMVGTDSVADYFEGLGGRPYERLVYSRLAELYLERELYSDAAETYRALAQRDPFSVQAPRLHMKVMEIYRKVGFGPRLLQSQTAFVQQYGLKREFWNHHNPEALADVVEQVGASLMELARHYHAQVQQSQEAADYHLAEQWYRAYLATFGNKAKAPAMNFALAELLHGKGEYLQAIEEYERTAYAYGEHPKAAEAGYAALLAYRTHVNNLSGADKAHWRKRSIDSTTRFAEAFPSHPEVALVLTKSAAEVLEFGQPDEARRIAEMVLRLRPPATSEYRQTAWAVLAHAQFDLEQYQAAENAYSEALRLPNREQAHRSELTDGLAASIYKQGEESLRAGATEGAVSQFMRIATVAPMSSMRVQAEYDASVALLRSKRWLKAIPILERLRDAYPEHPLQSHVHQNLALAYQQSAMPVKAAAELMALAKITKDGELRREGFLRAAELYEQAGQQSNAIDVLERYLEQFSHSLEQAMEVRQRLAVLNNAMGNESEYRRWLKEIIESDRTARAERTARVRFLAATATLSLAELEHEAFSNVRLASPLKRTMGEKKRLMQRVLERYSNAAAYGVAQVTTAATFHIADLYYELSRALLDSERPANLNAEGLEEYEILLEQQAFPFEEKAIEIYEKNVNRVTAGLYDRWIKKSIERLAELLPVRYAKYERSEPFVEILHY
jgi:tetratricopeptide (TPR) repeat protein